MQDFEKNRAEYITQLEIQVQNLQRQLNAIQADARWVPQVAAELDAVTQNGRITLSFGGKNQTAVVSFTNLATHSVTDVTTSVLELGFQEMINSRIRAVIEPEVQRMSNGVRSITSKSW
jgi:hypothetical protein